ncbi:hypothetical protein DSO57_1005439 [Entomophthora muscae]|uniref:Uncharacterized protein n=1 Tax=Entomophthora muscae TaxID=34485 RepID=A0ACC2SLC4_9FUNG|nr:hypothetical protein DSO57_1005439 [Entomophthora muscae]
MKTTSAVLSLLAIAAQARPTSDSKHFAFDPIPAPIRPDYQPNSGYQPTPLIPNYHPDPVVPDYQPVSVAPDYQPAQVAPIYGHEDSDDDCFDGVVPTSTGSGKLGITIRKGRCRSSVRAKNGPHGTKINAKSKGKIREIHL